MHLLKKILLKNQNRLTGWMAALGAVTGIFLLCATVQFYLDISAVLVQDTEKLKSDYISVHKKIGSSLLAGFSAKTFTNDDIRKMESQPFSKSVGRIEQGRFRVSGSLTPASGLPGMYTELYFEAIDSRYIDVSPEDWDWKPGTEEIPVILPASYLEMYNFGLAPSQNLPVLNEKSLSKFVFNLHIAGRNGNADMKGRIAGFSQRITTILVPQSFLRWANEQYGYKSAGETVHVVWEVEDVSDPRVAGFLRKNHLSTNEERLSGSRARSVMNVVLVVCLALGAIMVFLSVLVFMQYNQILMARKEYEIKVLCALGYSIQTLAGIYLVRYFLRVMLIAAAATGALWYTQQMLSSFFDRYQLVKSGTLYGYTLFALGVSVGVMLLFNSLGVVSHLRRLARQPG